MYARQERIEEELRYAKQIMEVLKAEIFGVTNKAVEETAQEIMDYLNMRCWMIDPKNNVETVEAATGGFCL